jgi:hypothetical protein
VWLVCTSPSDTAGVHVPGARPQGHQMRRRDWPARNEALRELGMSTRVTTQRWQGPGDVPTRSRRVDPQWGKPLRRAERGHLVDCEAPFGQQLHHVPVRQCVACTPLRPSDHQPDTSVDLAEISSVSRGTDDFIALN